MYVTIAIANNASANSTNLSQGVGNESKETNNQLVHGIIMLEDCI